MSIISFSVGEGLAPPLWVVVLGTIWIAFLWYIVQRATLADMTRAKFNCGELVAPDRYEEDCEYWLDQWFCDLARWWWFYPPPKFRPEASKPKASRARKAAIEAEDSLNQQYYHPNHESPRGYARRQPKYD